MAVPDRLAKGAGLFGAVDTLALIEGLFSGRIPPPPPNLE